MALCGGLSWLHVKHSADNRKQYNYLCREIRRRTLQDKDAYLMKHVCRRRANWFLTV